MPIKSNDLKKGDFVLMRDGASAQINDNGRGNIRAAIVWGDHGSIYVWDVESPRIDLTKAQLKARALVKAAGF
jgi:hypothetical protein